MSWCGAASASFRLQSANEFHSPIFRPSRQSLPIGWSARARERESQRATHTAPCSSFRSAILSFKLHWQLRPTPPATLTRSLSVCLCETCDTPERHLKISARSWPPNSVSLPRPTHTRESAFRDAHRRLEWAGAALQCVCEFVSPLFIGWNCACQRTARTARSLARPTEVIRGERFSLSSLWRT